MMQLHKDIEKFEQKKVKVVAICPEKLESVKKFISKNDFSFDFIADDKHFIADKYRQEFKILKLGRMPAQLLINKNEEVVFEHYSNSMADIVSNDEVLSKI